jgi:enoyl-CoA hydratase/carnithine racemase
MIRVEVGDDHVARIVLDRPEAKNALTAEMRDGIVDAVRSARSDGNVRALLITGVGDAFCAGMDLAASTVAQAGREGFEVRSTSEALRSGVQAFIRELWDLDKPTIAAVNGAAIGAGMDMALMCDMRVAARSARFAESYLNVGLVPGDGGCYYLPRLVGPAKALELLLTGDVIDAAEAERLGIVNRVVDDDVLLDETYALARRIAAKSPVPLRMIKRAVYQGLRSDLRTSLDLISSHFGIVAVTDDAEEAMSAFRERRDPDFTGH